ncbi:MAG: hypothetical protein ABEI57_04205, partial [Halapricum sp.]
TLGMGVGMAAGRLSRWTRYFTVASAGSLVVSQAIAVLGGSRPLVVAVAIFGFVCPMIFGMAYLLLPSYVGRTLADQRLPAVHFVLAYLGSGALVAGRALDRVALIREGVALWSLGVAVFVGALAWTVVPAVLNRPEVALRSDEAPQRSTRLATAMIAVALGYLVVGTGALLGWAGLGPVSEFAFPAVVHYYAAGLGALLIFALGTRLVPGFFHVTPPRVGTWVALVPGAVAPGLLGTFLWGGVIFRVGAALQAVAMAGYAGVVVYVFRRSDWDRVGLVGIVLGAVAGVVAVGINLPAAFGYVATGQIRAHAATVITGFFALTIVGYAVQFFAVTSGRFLGASDRGVRVVVATLAGGTVVRTGGLLASVDAVSRIGAGLALFGAIGYTYLVGRRFAGG